MKLSLRFTCVPGAQLDGPFDLLKSDYCANVVSLTLQKKTFTMGFDCTNALIVVVFIFLNIMMTVTVITLLALVEVVSTVNKFNEENNIERECYVMTV